MASQKLVVDGLADSLWSVSKVKDAFLPFGPVLEVTLGNKGRALVVFKNERDASEAAFNMDGAVVEGCTLTVVPARATGGSGGVLVGGRHAVWNSSAKPVIDDEDDE